MGLSIVLGMSAAGVELAAGRAIKSIDKIGSTVSRLKNRRLKLIEDNIDVKKASDRLSTLQKTIDALYKKRSAIKIKLSTAKSQDEIDALKRKLAETGRKISGLNAHKIKVADWLKHARMEAERTDKSIVKIGKTIESINRHKLAIDANLRKRAELKSTISDKIALGITVAAPLKFAVDFESAMARVKALSGATDEQFKALSDTARKLGATTVFSASEAAEGMQYLAMAGFGANDTIKAMPGLLNLAAAGQTELAETSDIASNILSGFGLKASEMARVADVMAKTMTTANVDTRMLGETMKYVAPVASGLGASIEEVSALAAKLGDVGIQGSMAGTTIKAMYSRLSAPPSATAKMLKELGIETKDASGKFKGMITLIGEINDATRNMADAERAEVMQKLFGQEALGGAIALMNVGQKKLQEYERTLKNASGAAAKIAKAQNDTVKGSIKALGSSLETLAISATTALLPAIKGVTLGIKWLSDKLTAFSSFSPTLTGVVFGATAAFAAFSIAAAGLGYVMTFVANGFHKVKMTIVLFRSALMLANIQTAAATTKTKALALWQGVLAAKTKIAALWTMRGAVAQRGAAAAAGIFKVAMAGVNLVMRANPIGLVVTAFGALAAAVVWAYNKFDWFKSGIDKVFGWLGEKFDWLTGAVGKIKSIGSSIASFFGFGDGEKKIEVAQTVKKVAVQTAVAAQVATAQPASPHNVAATAPTAQGTYNITINVQGGGDPDAIAKEVERAIRNIEQSRRNRSYADEAI